MYLSLALTCFLDANVDAQTARSVAVYLSLVLTCFLDANVDAHSFLIRQATVLPPVVLWKKNSNNVNVGEDQQ